MDDQTEEGMAQRDQHALALFLELVQRDTRRRVEHGKVDHTVKPNQR